MHLRWVIAFVVLSSLSGALAGADPAGKPIEEAIAHLGDPDPAVRDEAAKTLREAGANARAALQAASAGDDPEIAARARDILKSTPTGAAPLPADDEALDPAILRYRASAPAAKRQVIDFMSTTESGVRSLARLWPRETDPELRGVIFQELVKQPSAAAGALLGNGNVASAELLLQAAVDQKIPESAAAYAAYSLTRGKLSDAIRRWSARGGREGADAWAEQVLAALHRARGDVATALQFAQASNEPEVLRETRLWAGDWASVAADIRQENAATQTVSELAILVGIDSITGDAKGLEDDADKLKKLAHTPIELHAAANALVLAGRPDDAVELYTAAHDYAPAYELLIIRERFDDAAALLAAHDAETPSDAILLRCAAARSFARHGQIARATELLDRVVKENATAKLPAVSVALGEAEREAGLTARSWEHFSEAMEAGQVRSRWFLMSAFPRRSENIDWPGIWFSALDQNRRRPAREIFDRLRRAYDRTMPIEELTTAIKGVDLTSEVYRPYLGLAWEASERMFEAGDEAEGIKFAEEIAREAPGAGDLYLRLGDRAARKKDWTTAAARYVASWRKDTSHPLPLYLHGLALLRCGQVAEGRERISLAHSLALGDGALLDDLARGLSSRGFDEAAVQEAQVLTSIGHPLSQQVDSALRYLGEQHAEHARPGAAAGAWQRSVIDFSAGVYAFRDQEMYLYLANSARRAHARELLAAGDWPGAQQQIKLCYEMLPGDIEVAIDLVDDLEKSGRKAEANKLFAESFARQQNLCIRFPDSANQHNQIAWLAAKCHRELDRALLHGKRAVELAPDRTSVLDTLAEVYYQRGQYDEAIAEMNKCVKLEPLVYRHQQMIDRAQARK